MAAIVERAEGLPLYVVEAANTREGAAPSAVSALLRDRLATTGETATRLLAAAAVIGRSFDLPTLRRASGRSEDQTVDALDEVIRRGLVRGVGAGS